MNSMEQTIQELRGKFADTPHVLEEIDDFFMKKNRFLQDPTTENKIDMQMAFMYASGDLKVGLGAGAYSEADFRRYMDVLRYDPNYKDEE